MGKSRRHDSKSKSKPKRKEKKSKKHKHSKDRKNGHERKKMKTYDEKVAAINADFSIPVELMNNKSHAPETPEEYLQRQNRMHRELDPVTGRTRLIKGDGEVIEEIVSKERHRTINKEATKVDGEFYQKNTIGKL